MKLTTESNSRKQRVGKVIHDSFIGNTHKRNEDKILIVNNEDYIILGVFDGVGSAENNKLATQLAYNFISKDHDKYYDKKDFYLEAMITDLNKKIIYHPKSKSKALSTCAVCVYVFSTETLFFLTLGDTRIYAVGKHYAEKLTEDDVMSPGSNVITKCLGLDLDSRDISEISINNFQDNILICSDGFYKLFEKTKLTFFDAFLKKTSIGVKNNLQDLVKSKNSDDASYILFKNV